MKRIIFYDTTWNQILRVGNIVCKHMKEKCTFASYGVVFETAEKSTLPKSSHDYFDEYLVSRDIKEVNAYIKRVMPDVVVFAQNTIPDLDAILIARSIRAKIIMLQHGVLYDGASLNNVRIGEIIAALGKAKKTFGYFNILRVMCKEQNKSFAKSIVEILKKKNNVTTTIQNYFTPPLRGDFAFVIGEHWVDYYHDNYGYDKNNIFVMGNHDVDDLDGSTSLEEAICYIPSVHVEDGHVSKQVFDDFLKALSSAIPDDMKLYIKFHPRSNKEIYYPFFNEKNVTYVSNSELPYVRTYIGHNSSLLAKALQISGVLILWGFKEEPELFYKDFSYAVCNDAKSIAEAVNTVLNDKTYNRKSEIERFSYKNPIGAYNFCAEKIIELINNGIEV